MTLRDIAKSIIEAQSRVQLVQGWRAPEPPGGWFFLNRTCDGAKYCNHLHRYTLHRWACLDEWPLPDFTGGAGSI